MLFQAIPAKEMAKENMQSNPDNALSHNDFEKYQLYYKILSTVMNHKKDND
jgi:hypothetical protein